MDREARLTAYKAEVRHLAWTEDPQEKARLNYLKRRVYSMETGDPGSWQAANGQWFWEPNTELSEDLRHYHTLADALSVEDCFD